MKETSFPPRKPASAHRTEFISSASEGPKSFQEVMHERHKSQRNSPDVILRSAVSERFVQPVCTERIVVMGLSTGGVEALEAVVPYLPANSAPMAIVQHMPERMGDFFVKHLNQHCEMEVRKACHGDTMRRGQVLIAPGDRHMLLRLRGGQYFVELIDGPLVSLHRPSIDVLFRSAAYAGSNALGIIMTGMGDDGVLGLQEMRACGAQTVAQAESSCIAPSMPRAAVKCGAATEGASLIRITELIAQQR